MKYGVVTPDDDGYTLEQAVGEAAKVQGSIVVELVPIMNYIMLGEYGEGVETIIDHFIRGTGEIKDAGRFAKALAERIEKFTNVFRQPPKLEFELPTINVSQAQSFMNSLGDSSRWCLRGMGLRLKAIGELEKEYNRECGRFLHFIGIVLRGAE